MSKKVQNQVQNQEYFKIPQFKERCQHLIYHYGEKLQLIQTTQELAELIQSITKWQIEYKSDPEYLRTLRDNIKNELADAYIMQMQLKSMFGISEWEIGKAIDEKLTKIINQIKNN